jgi:hypothetical protein
VSKLLISGMFIGKIVLNELILHLKRLQNNTIYLEKIFTGKELIY